MRRLSVHIPNVANIEIRDDAPRIERRHVERELSADARIMIAQATGLLMQRHGLQADRALALLTMLARQKELRVSVLAERFVLASQIGRGSLALSDGLPVPE
jgi:AmiR/NasT family two-component response regulator